MSDDRRRRRLARAIEISDGASVDVGHLELTLGISKSGHRNGVQRSVMSRHRAAGGPRRARSV
jgi:hypothetical protein